MEASMYLERPEGRVAYSIAGDSGPWVVCVPSMGDLRAEYRYLVPALVTAGFRVACMDVRGHGESDTTFSDYSAAAVGSDIVALLDALGAETARVIGTSMAAAAGVWAAAEAPSRIIQLVLVGPVVRDLPTPAFLRMLIRVLFLRPWGATMWNMYYRSLYPSAKPNDFAKYRAALRANLAEPGRLEALQSMIAASKSACETRIPEVRVPTLVVMGTRDPDFPNPSNEASSVAARLSGQLFLVEGAGHYPHAETPGVVAPRVIDFLRESHA
jgi:pimeloyl-ACP methyl ester carboxylesterase